MESEEESPAPKDSSISKPVQRKLQVSNSYPPEFDQLARVLNCLLERRESKRINRKELKEDTGLADRQVESLASIGTATGLIKPKVQTLAPEGLAIAARDIFLERRGVLEWRHYKEADSYRNLVWFEAFNRHLKEESAMTREEWQEYFRNLVKYSAVRSELTWSHYKILMRVENDKAREWTGRFLNKPDPGLGVRSRPPILQIVSVPVQTQPILLAFPLGRGASQAFVERRAVVVFVKMDQFVRDQIVDSLGRK